MGVHPAGRGRKDRTSSPDPGRQLAIGTRRFGGIAATVVRRPGWYYHYFGGLRGVGNMERAGLRLADTRTIWGDPPTA